MYLRYSETTGLIGKAYNIPVPEPFIEITEEQNNEIQTGLWFVVNGELTQEPTSEYIEQEEKKEKERIGNLKMTGADVERAIYKVKGMDFNDILTMVKDYPTIDSKALAIEFKANYFYRGNPYVDQVGAILGISTDKMDKFFETGDPEDLR